VSKIRLSRVSVCGLLLIFFFLYVFLIFWKFQSPFLSPIYTTLSSLPICSHRATLGNGQTPHTSKELSIYLRKLYTEGITCVDVDIIKVFDGKVIIGHPSLVNREIGQGQDGPSIDTLFSFLKEFPKATATLELKGDLRDDIEFAKNAIRLMAIGGFVKYWAAIKEYEKWFIDIAKLNTEEVLDIRKTMPEYIFESMRPETKVSVE
jgi:hypothetical protein